MVRSMFWAGTPRPTDSAPCGSRSTSSTLRPCSTSAAPRLMVDVVLPTPPFWLHMAMIRAGPWCVIGFGSGSLRCRALAGSTRLVGMPISTSPAGAPPRGSATAEAAASARVDIVCASSLVLGGPMTGSGLGGRTCATGGGKPPTRSPTSFLGSTRDDRDHLAEGTCRQVPGTLSSAQRAGVAGGVHLTQPFDGDQRVDLRRRHRRVAQQLLDDADVGAAVEQVSGEGGPQRVRGELGVDPGPLRGLAQDRPGALPGERPPPGVEEHRARLADTLHLGP